MTNFYDFFDICYGQGEYNSKNHLNQNKNGIPLISSKGTDRGIYGYYHIKPKYKHVISVPRTGSVCQAFYQNIDCCIDNNCLVMIPKNKLSIQEMIYFSMLVKKESYKYLYGRQVTPDRLGNTTIPDIPKWINKKSLPDFNNFSQPVKKSKKYFDTKNWKWFQYDSIFNIDRGFYNKRPEKIGDINFISATGDNNGVTDKLAKDVIEKMYDGNCLTVVNNGASTATAFYQKEQFTCSHDVNIINTINIKLNPFIAMFLIPLIGLEKSRFGYGRKWRYARMLKTKIKLPVNSKNNPDWVFMEDYIKSLPYSSNLENT